MPERRKESPLRAMREQGRMRVQRGPSTIQVDPTFPGEGGLLVFCALLKTCTQETRRRLPPGRYNRGGMCGDTDCGRCPLLKEELDDRQPDYVWLCSRCTDGFSVQPYWADGKCDACGYDSPVLMLAAPL